MKIQPTTTRVPTNDIPNSCTVFLTLTQEQGLVCAPVALKTAQPTWTSDFLETATFVYRLHKHLHVWSSEPRTTGTLPQLQRIRPRDFPSQGAQRMRARAIIFLPISIARDQHTPYLDGCRNLLLYPIVQGLVSTLECSSAPDMRGTTQQKGSESETALGFPPVRFRTQSARRLVVTGVAHSGGGGCMHALAYFQD